MDNTKTAIDASKIEALLDASGLKVTPQKGFVRVDGNPGRRIYVAFTKTVRRIDIAGFEMRDDKGEHLPGYVTPHVGPFGSVKQQVDFSRTEDEILATVAELLETLKTLPAAEPKAKAAPKAKSEKAEDKSSWSPETKAAKESRLLALRAEVEAKRAARVAALEEKAAEVVASTDELQTLLENIDNDSSPEIPLA